MVVCGLLPRFSSRPTAAPARPPRPAPMIEPSLPPTCSPIAAPAPPPTAPPTIAPFLPWPLVVTAAPTAPPTAPPTTFPPFTPVACPAAAPPAPPTPPPIAVFAVLSPANAGAIATERAAATNMFFVFIAASFGRQYEAACGLDR